MTRCFRTPQVSRLLGAAVVKAEGRLPGEKGRGGKARAEEEARLHGMTGWESKDQRPCGDAAPA